MSPVKQLLDDQARDHLARAAQADRNDLHI
jgi:hypothetical protein